MKSITRVVNSTKGKTLETRIFRKNCKGISSLYINILDHTEIRWRPSDNLLKIVFQLKAELLIYLQKSEYQRPASNSL